MKPVVHFIGEARFADYYGIECAHVVTTDHPVWGSDNVRPSKIVQRFPDGSFETLNTVYKPINNEIQNP